MRLTGGMRAALLVGLLVAVSAPAAASLGTLAGPHTIRVTGSGFTPRAAIVVAQCGRGALAAAASGSASEALDYCDESRVSPVAADGTGRFATITRVSPIIQSATGSIDCRPAGACLLGALNLDILQGGSLQVGVSALSFSASAHDPVTPQRARIELPAAPRGVVSVTSAHPWRGALAAGTATGLGDGRTGFISRVASHAPPRHPVGGEGLLALTMSAPATSWSDAADTSVVAEVRVDHGPWQQIVLFEGATPFTYESFTGPLRTGSHTVAVRVRTDLSHVTRHAPVVRIVRQTLAVVPPSTALGVELAHAPVLFDRRVTPTRNTPLETYATDEPVPGQPGVRHLTYVVTWTREDAGTGFVPWLEWGTWGRMTDIETAISMDVDRQGRVSHPIYLACATCGPAFPENRTALDETDTPFAGRWYAGHPMLRVSTGNNDFSDVGTTPLRFQLALAAPPASGTTREGAMDRNPWTYAVMGQELARTRADYSTDPTSTGPGDPRQYLIVQLDTDVSGASAVGVDVRLAGSSTVYANDFGTTYPLYDGGSGRTVIKVPLSQAGRAITMLRLRLLAAGSGTPTITVHRVTVLQFTGTRIIQRGVPRPVIETVAPPPAATGGASITASP